MRLSRKHFEVLLSLSTFIYGTAITATTILYFNSFGWIILLTHIMFLVKTINMVADERYEAKRFIMLHNEKRKGTNRIIRPAEKDYSDYKDIRNFLALPFSIPMYFITKNS